MTLDDIDKAALAGEDITCKLLDNVDKIYFYAMQSLYESYHTGSIDRTEAAYRKTQLRRLVSSFDFDRQIYRQHQKIEDSLGGYRKELNTCGCEHCQRLLKILDGREIPN